VEEVENPMWDTLILKHMAINSLHRNKPMLPNRHICLLPRGEEWFVVETEIWEGAFTRILAEGEI
jgi:hypothetical protein